MAISSRLVVLAALLPLGLTGCGTKMVEQSEVEDQVRAGLERSVGQKPPPPDCPGDLEGKVGATMKCTVKFDDGTSLGVNVKVTSVEGDTVRFDIQADEQVQK